MFLLTSCRLDVSVDIKDPYESVSYKLVASGELYDYLLNNPSDEQQFITTISNILDTTVSRKDVDSSLVYSSTAKIGSESSKFTGLNAIKFDPSMLSISLEKPRRLVEAINSATRDQLDSNLKSIAYSKAVNFEYSACIKGEILSSSLGTIDGDCSTVTYSLSEFPDEIVWDISYKPESTAEKITTPFILSMAFIIIIILIRYLRR